ncbi:30S ribosomal protein S18 [candidate division WOR-3 bacterium]|nr:30S ribosomal protein S18 [candidate division WOR-3 bacterium]
MNRACYFCKNREVVDYKTTQILRKFMTPSNKIMPRRLTGLCAKHQRALTKAIKNARIIALLPFVPE